MKSKSLSYLLVLALALTFTATGCKKRPTGITKLPGSPVNVPDPNAADNSNKLNTPDETGSHPQPDFGGNLEDKFTFDRAAYAANTVHFDYDSAAIRSSERHNIEAVASSLKSATAGDALLVEGHCDERG